MTDSILINIIIETRRVAFRKSLPTAKAKASAMELLHALILWQSACPAVTRLGILFELPQCASMCPRREWECVRYYTFKLIFTPILYILYTYLFERRIRIYWICMNYTCERQMRYLVMLGMRVKSQNRECVVYKFESGARVRRAALPSHWQRRERGALAWRQLELTSSSSWSNDIERSRSGDPVLVEVFSNSLSESLRVYSCSCRRFSVVLA